MDQHEHFPDAHLYYSRQLPKCLTCLHCGKPIYCTNEHFNLLRAIPLALVPISFISQNKIVIGLAIALLLLSDEPLKQLIFPHLRLAIDHAAQRGRLDRR